MRNVCLFILIVFGAGSLRAEVEMILGVDRAEIYEGETFGYQIALVDRTPIDDSVVPDLAAFSDFRITTLPKKTTVTPTLHGVQFTYVLAPLRSGSLVIPVPKISVNGRAPTLGSVQVGRRKIPSDDGSISVTVRPPDKQDLVFLEIEVDRKRLYPLQPATLTLIVQVHELPEAFQGRNRSPLSALNEPPMLTIPWVDDASLPKGIKPHESRSEWLTALQSRRGQRGFAINDYGSQNFSFSFNRSGIGFDGLPSRMNRTVFFEFLPNAIQVTRKNFDGKETTYWEYRFSRTFIPTEPGNHQFGPVSLKGEFAVQNPSSGDLVARSVYAVAPAVSVEVLDVPKEGRPDDYIGAFGSFDWSADLQPRRAKVGEPLTLTLRLSGHGSTVAVRPPDLTEHPEVARTFKTYPPTENIEDDACVFSYTIRPTEAGSIVFPSIPISFFDVKQERFVSVQSEPIPLEVSESTGSRSAQHFAEPKSSFRGELERSEKGLFANMTAMDAAVDRSVNYVRWAGAILSFGAVYLVLVAGVTVWRRYHADPRRRRRNGALARALRRLEEIRKQWSRSDHAPETLNILCGELRGALCGYVADLGDGVEQGMTTKDACWKLLEMGASEKSVGEVRGILETLDGARYGGVDLRSLDEMLRGTDALVRRLRGEIFSEPPHGRGSNCFVRKFS